VSRARFAVLLVLLAAVVAVGSFALTYALLNREDDEAGAGPAAGDTTTTTEPASGGGDPAPGPGPLVTPAWVAIVASDPNEGAVRAVADRVGATGRTPGVLHSSDHSSLAPDLWVAYVGPFPDRGGAEAEVAALAADGFPGAYARCVGTADECS
jgi:hypothetical protein